MSIGHHIIHSVFAIWAFVHLVLFSCTSTTSVLVSEENNPVLDTVRFSASVESGTLDNNAINEVSGLAASIQHPNYFWVHNDSSDKPRVFMLDGQAKYQSTYTIAGITNRDWEDISLSKDPRSGTYKLFIGDIGDNLGVHPYCTIYVIDEPSPSSEKEINIQKSEKILYRYADGSRDAESMMVDPLTGDIYIASKREENINLYKILYPYNLKDTIIAEKVLTMPFTYFVGGDISADGSEILMKTYQKIYYWKRKSGSTVEQALSNKPQEIPYNPEPQGEAICWSWDNKSFYTLSEESPFKIVPVFYRFDKK